jgi:hypothetical protein
MRSLSAAASSVQRSGPTCSQSTRDIQAPGARAIGGFAARSASAGIDRSIGAVRGGAAGGDLGRDRGTGAEAGVYEIERLQPVERGLVQMQALRLADHRAVPVDPEPGEVLLDPGNEFLAGAAGSMSSIRSRKAPPCARAKRCASSAE